MDGTQGLFRRGNLGSCFLLRGQRDPEGIQAELHGDDDQHDGKNFLQRFSRNVWSQPGPEQGTDNRPDGDEQS
jgi:hypothetical protein